MLFAGTEALRKLNPVITMGQTRSAPLSSARSRAGFPGWELRVFFPTNPVLLQEITGLACHPTSAAHRGFHPLLSSTGTFHVCAQHQGTSAAILFAWLPKLKSKNPFRMTWMSTASAVQPQLRNREQWGNTSLYWKKILSRKARKYSRSPNTNPGRAAALETTPFGLENFKWEFLPSDCSRCLAVLSTHSNPWAKLSSDLWETQLCVYKYSSNLFAGWWGRLYPFGLCPKSHIQSFCKVWKCSMQCWNFLQNSVNSWGDRICQHVFPVIEKRLSNQKL